MNSASCWGWGSSMRYLETKSWVSRLAVAYSTILGPAPVQRRMPMGGLSHCRGSKQQPSACRHHKTSLYLWISRIKSKRHRRRNRSWTGTHRPFTGIPPRTRLWLLFWGPPETRFVIRPTVSDKLEKGVVICVTVSHELMKWQNPARVSQKWRLVDL